jgi:hypothetical protein
MQLEMKKQVLLIKIYVVNKVEPLIIKVKLTYPITIEDLSITTNKIVSRCKGVDTTMNSKVSILILIYQKEAQLLDPIITPITEFTRGNNQHNNITRNKN